MGDSMAPKITLVNTGSDATSKLKVHWEVVPPNTADAISTEANVAFNLSLRSQQRTPSLPSATETCPPGTEPKDFYFPSTTRNLAPVISFEYNESISISYDKINPSVAGVSACAPDSIAFWKAPNYKYSAPDAPEAPMPEIISTEPFEAYFPTRVRNVAPMINMKKPAGDWDKSAFLEVGNEFVALSGDLARELSASVKANAEDPSLAAAAFVATYFGDDVRSMAPQITIDRTLPMVEFCMSEVKANTKDAAAILAAAPRGV